MTASCTIFQSEIWHCDEAGVVRDSILYQSLQAMRNKVIFVKAWGWEKMGKQAGLFHFNFPHSSAWILPLVDISTSETTKLPDRDLHCLPYFLHLPAVKKWV